MDRLGVRSNRLKPEPLSAIYVDSLRALSDFQRLEKEMSELGRLRKLEGEDNRFKRRAPT